MTGKMRQMLSASVLVIVLMMCDQSAGFLIIPHMLDFQDCGSRYDLISVSISSCTYVPCMIPTGVPVTLSAEFDTYGSASPILNHEAEWLLNNVYTKADVSPEKCMGSACPTKGEEGLQFSAQLNVDSRLPTLRGSLFWRVYNDAHEMVMCYKIPIALTT